MNNSKQNVTGLAEQLSHPDLPKEIFAAYRLVNGTDITKGKQEILENVSGGTFLKELAGEFLGMEDLRIVARKYEKPRAFEGNNEISVSFSHTNNAITAAISGKYLVGCDMELASRNVHPKLQNRIKQEDELNSFYEQESSIRIWTLKESALKMIGTGLRKPMNCVRIEPISKALFFVHFDNGKRAKICSFKHQDHWISICYQ